MKLKDLAKKGLCYHISMNILQPEIEEKLIQDVEIVQTTYKTMITLMVYDATKLTGKDEPTIVAKVQAVGLGKTQRASERDGIKECLNRVAL
jgi:hypothetical protein